MVFLAPLPFDPLALAQDERPVVVEYTAPTPECASSEAFQALLRTEIARSARFDRSRRFKVRIVRQDGLYEGTLTAETGVRKVTATQCNDLTSALAVIIAVADPSADSPSPSNDATDAPDPAPVTEPGPPPVETPPAAERGPERGGDAARFQWRLGARGIASTHPTWGFPSWGGMGAISLEIPGGFRKMMFELGGGFSIGQDTASASPMPSGIAYVIVDTQACLLDLPIEKTELSVLGCLRVAGAAFTATGQNFLIASTGGVGNPSHVAKGGALWSGASVRLRWQTPHRLFFEANFDGMYGTVSQGEDNTPGWFAMGLGAGFQIL